MIRLVLALLMLVLPAMAQDVQNEPEYQVMYKDIYARRFLVVFHNVESRYIAIIQEVYQDDNASYTIKYRNIDDFRILYAYGNTDKDKYVSRMLVDNHENDDAQLNMDRSIRMLQDLGKIQEDMDALLGSSTRKPSPSPGHRAIDNISPELLQKVKAGTISQRERLCFNFPDKVRYPAHYFLPFLKRFENGCKGYESPNRGLTRSDLKTYIKEGGRITQSY